MATGDSEHAGRRVQVSSADPPGATHRFRATLRRFQLAPLMERYPPRLVLAAFNLVNGFVSIGVIAAVAVLLSGPFVFPSAGASAFVLFFAPLAPPASPRNTILGHLVGALAGFACLAAFGLLGADPALPGEMDWSRTLAAAGSLGITGAVMVLLRVPHPPAGATALIVSLGLLTEPLELAVLMLAIGLLVLQALIINRAAGLAYPLWAHPDDRRQGVRF